VDHHTPDVGGHVVEHGYRSGVIPHGMDVHPLLDVDLALDDRVRPRAGDAQQRRTLRALGVEQRERRRVAEVYLAVQHDGLAGAAGAVRAGVREPDALAQARVEDGLVVAAADLRAERLDGDREAGHRKTSRALWPMPRSARDFVT